MSRLFPISIEVEEEAVGRVLRVLNATAGIAKLHLRLDKEVKPEQQPAQEGGAVVNAAPVLKDGRRKRRGGPPGANPCFKAIAEVLLKTPAHYRMLIAALERAGYSGSGIHGFTFRMGKLKFIQRTAPGTYKLTEKGLKIFGKKEPDRSTGRLLPPAFYKVTNNYSGFRLFVLTHLNENGETNSFDMRQLVKGHGFSEKNLSTTGMKLRTEGLISVKDGWYSITDKGKMVLDNRPSPDNDLNSNQEGLEANG
jgi:predicted transcriptional regulator